jgi:hypothetical protein
MGPIEAGAWGLVGGLAAGLITLMVAVTEAGFHWPWRNANEEIWPRLFVVGCGLLLGGLVAAAAHAQMSGAWPAFIMGVGAPSIVRGMLHHVEVTGKADEIAGGADDAESAS